jgi:hypothetical protein
MQQKQLDCRMEHLQRQEREYKLKQIESIISNCYLYAGNQDKRVSIEWNRLS